MKKQQRINETIWKGLFLISAVLSIFAVAAILIFLLIRGYPALAKIGLFKFIFGTEWNPSAADTYANPLSGTYGILPMIVGSVYSTVGAVIIGGGLGFFTAVFLAKFCPRRLKKPLTQIINLLAGIPSIIYGFFALTVLSPLIGQFSENGSGMGVLSVSIVLGIMILPTIVSLSKTSIEAVDKSYYEAAIALGATHEQAVFKIVVPAAKSGIISSVILGIGRAIGETMAVVMIAGGQAKIPDSLIKSFRTMTGNIVMEMGYAGEVQMGALIATGVVLLVFVLIINALLSVIKNGGKKERRFLKRPKERKLSISDKDTGIVFAGVKKSKVSYFLCKAGKFISYLTAAAGVAALFAIIAFIFIKGIPNITTQLLFGEMTSFSGAPTIASSIVSTLMMIFMTSIMAFPIGIFAAIFLVEYTKKGSKLVKVIRYGVDTLAAVPSIVFALFGLIFFCGLMGLGTSIWAGCLTISLMIIPTIVRAVEEALLTVPDSFREGSYALGGGKIRTIYKVVLPSALPGILAAVILGTGRMIGESAPFVFTMGSTAQPMPKGYKSAGATLAVMVYALAREGRYMNEAYATATVLIILVLGLNLLAAFLGNKLQKVKK